MDRLIVAMSTPFLKNFWWPCRTEPRHCLEEINRLRWDRSGQWKVKHLIFHGQIFDSQSENMLVDLEERIPDPWTLLSYIFQLVHNRWQTSQSLLTSLKKHRLYVLAYLCIFLGWQLPSRQKNPCCQLLSFKNFSINQIIKY